MAWITPFDDMKNEIQITLMIDDGEVHQLADSMFVVKNVEIIEVYDFYDCPVLFLAKLKNNAKALYMALDLDPLKFLAAVLTEEHLKELVSGSVSIRDFYNQQTTVWIVNYEKETAEMQKFAKGLPEDYLPEQGGYLAEKNI